MGSKQLDEMINTYVPGNKSIQDKRAAVSMEFYQHVCQTGEMSKFFVVYPSLGSTSESPASSMLDSGYASNFTSPVMSESQWTQAGNTSFSSAESHARMSSQKAALSADFSHLPGMKIMTRDGTDVTNSASRGCKTKEQRDHAHLMRIIKACEACRKKKVRCDPSHKRSAGSSGAKTSKTSKKTKKAATSTAPPTIAPHIITTESLDQSFFTPQSFNSIDPMNPASSFSFDSVMPESLVDPTMEWDQFIQYNEEPNEMIPVNYDFLFDPAGYFSPSSSNSLSSSQPFTPAQSSGIESVGVTAGTAEAEFQAPLPPYLNPGGEAGNDYADFNLYSPGSSSVGLDDDPTLIKDLMATSRPDYSEYLSHQRQLYDGGRREDHASQSQGPVASTDAEGQMPLFSQEEPFSSAALDCPEYYQDVSHGPIRWPYATSGDSGLNNRASESQTPDALSRLNPGVPVEVDGLQSQLRTTSPSTVPNGTTRSSVSPFRNSAATYVWPSVSILYTPKRDLKLRQLQKPRIFDETTKSGSAALPGGLTDGVSQSVYPTSRTPQTMRTTAGRRHPSTSPAGLSARKTEPSILAIDNSGLAPGSVAAANVSGSGSVLGRGDPRSVPSFASLSSVDQGVTSSDILLSTVTAVAAVVIAVCLLVLVVDIAHLKDVSNSLRHGILGKAASEEAKPILFQFASLLAAVASTAISKQPLSFLRRLPMAVMDDMKSPNLGLYRKISSIRSNLRRESSFQSSNGTKGVMTRLSLTTRPLLICSN